MAVSYCQDRFLTLYHGDCRDMAEIAANSVHCVVTSPPYLSKRIYKLEPLIWDGAKDCKHEWGKEISSKENDSNRGNMTWTTGGNPAAKVNGQKVSQGQYCQLCGAWRGHLGLEPDPSLYIQHLIEIFREVRRVLRPDGLLWVNLSDTHAGGGNNQGSSPDNLSAKQLSNRGAHGGPMEKATPIPKGLHPGDLIGIPWRFALAMQQDGWHLRQDIIWHKPAPMPESVNGVRWERCRVKVKPQGKGKSQREIELGIQDRNGGINVNPAQYADCPGCPKCAPNDGLVLRQGNWRPTASHEYIFMFAKSDRYYADREAVKVPHIRLWNPQTNNPGQLRGIGKYHVEGYGQSPPHGFSNDPDPAGRNKRSVWTIGPEPFTGSINGISHFAAFPTELPEICINASTSEAGVCPKCGSQWARVVKPSANYELHLNTQRQRDRWYYSIPDKQEYYGIETKGTHGVTGITPDYETLGWRATCSCQAGQPIPALVLDPFAGTFATGEAAVKLGRRAIGYELSEDYCRLAAERNQQGGLC